MGTVTFMGLLRDLDKPIDLPAVGVCRDAQQFNAALGTVVSDHLPSVRGL